ncbi:M1 family aminopeptidase [Tenacibaculum singaporense]|uniref:Peptidase M1 n=1 Tax=Tenacibaculum singaporense TaxID=2358479 RepID=A0A451EMK8_9FLAO|nr:M1 family aminopeptidase [Tenacibaculum singaporense]AZJ37051.1 peptidase M1 [Tenacibaculum singaporense]
MWYEIFKFELKYRAKRPETYVFFVFLFLFSIVGVDFVFQGVEIGLMKKNSPLIVAKTMGAITGIFMIMASMIMGVPVLRDYQYNIEALLFTNPIKKRDYLLGRFLGSFTVLLIIFSGVLFGMMVGEHMPWHKDMLPFNTVTYIQSFVIIVFPILFFGASLFFVSGMLSRKLLVVYTQGIILFVVFLLTKAVTNEFLQAILDPFSLTTLTQVAKDLSAVERNTFEISFSGVVLYNKLFWSLLGIVILFIGYRKFSFSLLTKIPKQKKVELEKKSKSSTKMNYPIPTININYNFKTQCLQLLKLSQFYVKSLLKETSFWAIAICGIIIILINSVNLGTVYDVDSYPATYFIVEELQEMSMYFFIIILIFYSGELIWKERTVKLNLIYDATSISDVTAFTSKFIALIVIYMVLMLSLIATGILFQMANGYYQFELAIYFYGFFVEILPFLMLYTFVAFFFQAISNHKFVGIFLVLLFFIANIASEYLGFQHSLYKFGGKTLGTYSAMNGYGHFLQPYLWIKVYWFVFGIMLLIISALLITRGTETHLIKRLKAIKYRMTKPLIQYLIVAGMLFWGIGSYIFYNTNILNDYWTNTEEIAFRVNYEKTLKSFEYLPQPKITAVNLKVELYPKTRAYSVEGYYMLKNTFDEPINEIHIQKLIASHVQLDSVTFDGATVKSTPYNPFEYTVYTLSEGLQPNDSIKMSFKQSYTPKGFSDESPKTHIVHNGTFFNNEEFPTIGYNRKYELRDADERAKFQLAPRLNKVRREDANELVNARSGSDSDGIHFEMVIGTASDQTAVVPGNLIKQWKEGERNYFHYKMNQPMINFYSVVSAKYTTVKDKWLYKDKVVDLEIYYHKKHNYNLDRMMLSMKKSLEYFSTHFSPYQYKQLRIMEFPRYAEFAQSFPGTIPFSEAIGFVLDIDDEKDVDMAFYVTAHEVAHQWWGMQIEAANVQGKHMILETLAQYGALMVLKNNYPKEKVTQFLAYQEETYNRERKKTKTPEPSLALVGNQDYVYYNKGALAMYILQDKIGEDKVNLALQRFIEDWNTYNGKIKATTNRYATTKDLLHYLKEVIPSSSQYLLHDLFETVDSKEILLKKKELIAEEQ